MNRGCRAWHQFASARDRPCRDIPATVPRWSAPTPCRTPRLGRDRASCICSNPCLSSEARPPEPTLALHQSEAEPWQPACRCRDTSCAAGPRRNGARMSCPTHCRGAQRLAGTPDNARHCPCEFPPRCRPRPLEFPRAERCRPGGRNAGTPPFARPLAPAAASDYIRDKTITCGLSLGLSPCRPRWREEICEIICTRQHRDLMFVCAARKTTFSFPAQIESVLDKGKPVVRRGRKAMGS